MTRIGPMRLPSRIARSTFDLYLHTDAAGDRYIALVHGSLTPHRQVLVRVDSNCVWAHVFGSARCDCAEQLHEALRRIGAADAGILVHAYDQDGRGISLEGHVRVYMEQDRGFDSVTADERCGFTQFDRRSYDGVAAVLRDHGVGAMTLLTNDPNKVRALVAAGFAVTREPLESAKLDRHNAAQLVTKKARMGHLLSIDLSAHAVRELFDQSLRGGSSSDFLDS